MATSRPRITARASRRFGEVLGGSKRLASSRLQTPPGQHGPMKAAKRGKETDYGRQLKEKQKARYVFGIKEKQFRSYVEKAHTSDQVSNLALHVLLEKRLDNVVYRLGFAPTRAAGRQMVCHNLILINGKRMNIPSYQVQTGDVISVRSRLSKSIMMDHLKARLAQVTPPSWIARDDSAVEAKILGAPIESDFDRSFDARQIIEFYSR